MTLRLTARRRRGARVVASSDRRKRHRAGLAQQLVRLPHFRLSARLGQPLSPGARRRACAPPLRASRSSRSPAGRGRCRRIPVVDEVARRLGLQYQGVLSRRCPSGRTSRKRDSAIMACSAACDAPAPAAVGLGQGGSAWSTIAWRRGSQNAWVAEVLLGQVEVDRVEDVAHRVHVQALITITCSVASRSPAKSAPGSSAGPPARHRHVLVVFVARCRSHRRSRRP